MTQLTNEMIIQSLNNRSPFMSLDLILLGGMLLIVGISYFFKIKKEKDSRRKSGIIIGVILIAFLIGIPILKSSLKYSAIQYSIENNCFEVVTDTVARTNSRTYDDGAATYYVYLTNNGKVTVNSSTYDDCSSGKSVYVVIAKGRFGGKYPTGQLYLTSKYDMLINKKERRGNLPFLVLSIL